VTINHSNNRNHRRFVATLMKTRAGDGSQARRDESFYNSSKGETEMAKCEACSNDYPVI